MLLVENTHMCMAGEGSRNVLNYVNFKSKDMYLFGMPVNSECITFYKGKLTAIDDMTVQFCINPKVPLADPC